MFSRGRDYSEHRLEINHCLNRQMETTVPYVWLPDIYGTDTTFWMEKWVTNITLVNFSNNDIKILQNNPYHLNYIQIW